MSAPTVSQRTWRSLVDEVEPDRFGPEETYRFSNDRVFQNKTDRSGGYIDEFDEYEFDYTLA